VAATPHLRYGITSDSFEKYWNRSDAGSLAREKAKPRLFQAPDRDRHDEGIVLPDRGFDDAPKVENLMKMFPGLWNEKPCWCRRRIRGIDWMTGKAKPQPKPGF